MSVWTVGANEMSLKNWAGLVPAPKFSSVKVQP